MDAQSLVHDVPVEGGDLICNGEQYLTFLLEQEHYAVDILCVEEIRNWTPPTKIPNAPNYVKGVINMRGVIIPIIDLRLKFNIGNTSYTDTTVVVVLTIVAEHETKTIGYVVDAVSDVILINNKEIESQSGFVGRVPPENILGRVNINDGVVTVLNILTLYKIEH